MSSNVLLVIGVIGIFAYWTIRERIGRRANPTRSGHPKAIRIATRLLIPVAGGLIIVQALGFLPTSFLIPQPAQSLVTGIGHIIFWLSLVLAVWSRETLGNHWAHAADYQVLPGQQLVAQGPYRYVRHPIYTTFLLMFIGAEIALNSWFIVLALPLAWYCVWQARKEELILEKHFRKQWEQYKQRTGMFLPKI